MDVISAYLDVGTYRGAAAICGTTHKTVMRIIEAHVNAGEPVVAKPVRARNYDEVADLVASRVKATSGKITAKRLLPEAVAAGYSGSARNFRRLVAEAKQAWRSDHPRGRRPGVWTPGDLIDIDVKGRTDPPTAAAGRPTGAASAPGATARSATPTTTPRSMTTPESPTSRSGPTRRAPPVPRA